MGVRDLFLKRRDELLAISDARANWNSITEWHARTRPLVSREFSDQLKAFDEIIKLNWFRVRRSLSLLAGETNDMSATAREKKQNSRIAENARNKLLAQIDALIELLDSEDESQLQPTVQFGGSREVGTSVFLVHGHDELALHETARFLEQLDLDVTVLREQPNSGRTIIEKFFDYSDVAFAVVLLTGDDRGGTKDAKLKDQLTRARQNVILELGFFLGKLGRGRVCTLYQPDVEVPSDYSGVLFVPMDNSGAWRHTLARELKAAQLPVNMNNVI